MPITLIMASCSSSQKKPEPVENFVTYISEDGTKKFSYSLAHSSPRDGNKKGGGRNKGSGGGRGGKGGGQGRNRGSSRDHIKLDDYFDHTTYQFRGQCEEKANNEDYSKFPNQ